MEVNARLKLTEALTPRGVGARIILLEVLQMDSPMRIRICNEDESVRLQFIQNTFTFEDPDGTHALMVSVPEVVKVLKSSNGVIYAHIT